MNNVEDLAKNTEVVAIAGQLLLVAAVFKFQTDTGSFLGALRGLQDVKIPMYTTLLHIGCRFSNINLLRPLY
jgi:MATE family multidrug resistance protein